MFASSVLMMAALICSGSPADEPPIFKPKDCIKLKGMPKLTCCVNVCMSDDGFLDLTCVKGCMDN